MTNYTTVKVNISEGQKQKLHSAVKGNCPVSICLGHEDLRYYSNYQFTSKKDSQSLLEW